MTGAPRFRRLAPGLYATADGRYELIQLDGGRTRAWNVELSAEAVAAWVAEDPERRSAYSPELDTMPVDGAATKRDALALFAEWWRENGEAA